MDVVAGVSLKNLRPRVWDHRAPEFVSRLSAIMISFDELYRRPALFQRVMNEGLASAIGLDSPGADRSTEIQIYIDNGSFSCLRRGSEPAIEAFKAFVAAVRPAWYPVPADYIPRPCDSQRRQRDLFRKTIAVLELHAGDGSCPVIHAGPWLNRYLDALRRLGLTRRLAVGGLVPHLLNSEGAQRKRTIAALRGVRREFPGEIHAFGVGGVVTLHLAAALGFDSADSSGWRQRAARGLVVLRGRGERQAVPLGSWKGRALDEAEWAELGRCRCPACRAHGIDGLKSLGVEGFSRRAVHNLVALLGEAALIDRHLARGDFPGWSRRRIGANRMAGLVTLALDAAG